MMETMIMVLRTNGVTVNNAAKRLGVTVGRVRQLLADGTLSGEKIGPRCWLIDETSIQRYSVADRRPGRKPAKNS